MSGNNESMKKILASIPDELAKWLDEYVAEKYQGIRGGKSIAVTNALRLLREQDRKRD